MESLANLECFVRSAESGSFSAAARRLALTPAAVSRNVAHLERNLGVQLFQRSTRGLTPTEAGDRFLLSVRSGLDSIQGAIADLMVNAAKPSGVLKLSVPAGFGMDYLLPLMPAFLERYPEVRPDWFFDNRPVDLIGEGFDVAIGGGFELPAGMVARELGRIHLIAVASPAYMVDKLPPKDPADLARLGSVSMRSPLSSRQRAWVMRNSVGTEMAVAEKPVMLVNDPDAVCRSALLGIGVGVVSLLHAAPHLASGALVRVLEDWHVDAGPLSLYFSNQKLLPAKTRAFVDFITESFRAQKLPRIERNRR
ncbi:LysR family transcriptional regulator [Burkholderia sp. NRF60-BP8]|uniref:LysR family transcriptional regulator n=1 Tax=Burkholderia sp. NRF60-BP8 TaxID=1637853 RepID=UPI00075E2CBB|nr:LysR family transcriptional regulator [Burkholderia sp. NRF60-BP8]AOI78175.1 LysR family transcriptional regulator [Burkholderia sp. NRF60-BP8]KVA10268.1 LysR family transcriptional regulator [Burkholderia sp. NRF60-BP8]